MGIKVFLNTGCRFTCLKCELVILESATATFKVTATKKCSFSPLADRSCFLQASDNITETIPAESEDPFCHQEVSLKRSRSEIWREVSCGREDDVSQSLEREV